MVFVLSEHLAHLFRRYYCGSFVSYQFLSVKEKERDYDDRRECQRGLRSWDEYGAEQPSSTLYGTLKRVTFEMAGFTCVTFCTGTTTALHAKSQFYQVTAARACRSSGCHRQGASGTGAGVMLRKGDRPADATDHDDHRGIRRPSTDRQCWRPRRRVIGGGRSSNHRTTSVAMRQ